MSRLKSRKAFTIVEMVIVIAVIAILAVAIIPTVSAVIQKANVSADTQFAASLNVQLAMWEVEKGAIKNESDLRNAINNYYGEFDEDGNLITDYYASLAPKSGKHGYHYWYDVENRQIILSTYDKLAGTEVAFNFFGVAYADDVVASEENDDVITFSSASLRSLAINGKNYFLMDQKGSELADLICGIETLPHPDEYLNFINKLNSLSTDNRNDEKGVSQIILAKLQETTIITDGGAFRYSDVDAIKHVWISPKAKVPKQILVYVYNGVDDVADGKQLAIAGGQVSRIELPENVYISLGGLPAIYVDSYTDEFVRNYDNTTKLYVQTNSIDEIQKIFTDCVIVTPNGSRYVWLGEKLYTLPVNFGSDGLPSDSFVGSVDEEIMNDIKDFDIICDETEANIGGKVYLYNGKLYVAYDKGFVHLSLTNSITDGMVTWSSDDENLAVVDGNGNVTLKLPEVVAGADYEATITATYKHNTEIKASITVYVARPVSANFSVGGSSYVLFNDMNKGNINISYTGDNLTQEITLVGTEFNDNEYVVPEIGTLSFETSGTLFTVENNVLTLNQFEGTQELTISYVGESGTEYFEKTFVVTVVDNSATGLEKNWITSQVQMGEDYLFRVGNGNSFTLDKLFIPTEANKEVVIEKVEIFDASKTDEQGNRGAIATSGSGFRANDTSSIKNLSSTIKFEGTGVAIIKITTTKGEVELAVEVVSGMNVTTAGDFSNGTNFVVLNDITWGTAKDIEIKGNIYGNGFAINAKNYLPAVSGNTAMFKLNNGTIDNLVINGPVYTTLSYSGGDTYVAGIYAIGDSKITNSYIAGFREPIMANGTSLYLDNTTLVGGNYGNLWLQTGSLTLKNVTTVQKPTTATIGSGTVLGAGIIADKGIDASNVTIIGDLTQYNWVSKDQASDNMDSDVRSLINTFYNNAAITHNVGGTKYINTGIVFQGTTGTVNNNSQTAGHGYTTENISGSLLGVTVEGMIYTRTTTNGAVTSVPTYGGYTPNAQATFKPTFNHNLTLQNGAYNISINVPAGETKVLDVSGYTVSKYTGQTIIVNVTCTGVDGGVTKDGNKFTFSKAGNYTLTYMVEDNTFFKFDGSRNENTVKEPYTVKVAVSNSNHPNAVINGANTPKQTKYKEVSGGLLDTDYEAWFELLDGVTITDYNEDGTPFTVTPTATDLKGLTITVVSGTQSAEITKTSTSGGYWMYDSKANKGNTTEFIVKFRYSYTGMNNKTVTVDYTASLAAGTECCGKTAGCEICNSGSSEGGDSGCVTPDTLVTLANGNQVRVDSLTGDELLLVWNMETGKFDFAPIMFVDTESVAEQEVVHLYFSDGTDVKVIYEHGFWDYDLNKYVYLDETASDYIGHWFAKQNGDKLEKVQLVDVVIEMETTTAWSPVTAGHLCYFVNGMLSMPGGVGGLFNIFDVDAETMIYDYEAMLRDIETYGLFTYEEMNAIVPLSEDMFNMAGGAYLKISIGKGNMTMDDLVYMIERYSIYFN